VDARLRNFHLERQGSFAYTDTSASPAVRFYRASISSSGQQSCNVVGYVDRTMPAGESMHCYPLDAVDNRLSAILPSMPEGTVLYKYDEFAQQFVGNNFFAGAWSDPNMNLAPGEGAIINPPSAIARTFAGEVQQGYGG